MNHLIKSTIQLGRRNFKLNSIVYSSNTGIFTQNSTGINKNVLVNNSEILNSNRNIGSAFYSSLSKAKIQKIKLQRDEKAKLAQKEKEQSLLDQANININSLSFSESISYLEGKFQQYHQLSPKLVGQLFKKIQNAEEIKTTLIFYKKLKITNPNYINSTNVQYIYEAFKRAGCLQMFAEVIMDSKTFQIFVKPKTVIKTIAQLLKEHNDHQLCINLWSHYLSISPADLRENFSRCGYYLCVDMMKEGVPLTRLYPFFKFFPTTPQPLAAGAPAIKFILRDAVNRGTAKIAIEAMSTTINATNQKSPFDLKTLATVISTNIIANPSDSLNDSSIQSQISQNPLLEQEITDAISKNYETADENAKSIIKQSIQIYYNQNNLPKQLQAL